MLLDGHRRLDRGEQGRRRARGAVHGRGHRRGRTPLERRERARAQPAETSEAELGEILDAWFAAGASAEPEDRANIEHLRELVPRSGPGVLAQLSVRNGRAAVDFYKQALGAVEVYRVGGTDEHEAVVSQLTVGATSFWVADESPEHLNFSPESLGGGTARMLLVVGDPDAAVARALAAGAREIRAVADERGWRMGRIEDPFGHHWEIGRPPVPWPPHHDDEHTGS